MDICVEFCESVGATFVSDSFCVFLDFSGFRGFFVMEMEMVISEGFFMWRILRGVEINRNISRSS